MPLLKRLGVPRDAIKKSIRLQEIRGTESEMRVRTLRFTFVAFGWHFKDFFWHLPRWIITGRQKTKHRFKRQNSPRRRRRSSLKWQKMALAFDCSSRFVPGFKLAINIWSNCPYAHHERLKEKFNEPNGLMSSKDTSL